MTTHPSMSQHPLVSQYVEQVLDFGRECSYRDDPPTTGSSGSQRLQCCDKDSKQKRCLTSPNAEHRENQTKKPSCHDFLPRPEAAGPCLPPCLGTCPVFASINPLWPQTPEEGVSVLMSQGSPSTCIFGFHAFLPPQETHSNDCPLLP